MLALRYIIRPEYQYQDIVLCRRCRRHRSHGCKKSKNEVNIRYEVEDGVDFYSIPSRQMRSRFLFLIPSLQRSSTWAGVFVDGQAIGQLTGEFVDGQTISQLTCDLSTDRQLVNSVASSSTDRQLVLARQHLFPANRQLLFIAR